MKNKFKLIMLVSLLFCANPGFNKIFGQVFDQEKNGGNLLKKYQKDSLNDEEGEIQNLKLKPSEAKDSPEYIKQRLKQLEQALRLKTKKEIIEEKKLEPENNKGLEEEFYSEKEELEKKDKKVYISEQELEKEIDRRLDTEILIKNFGHDFFARGEVARASLFSNTAPSDYQLGPGDELKIIVWSELGDETVYDVQVNPEGQVYVPMLGVIGVSGLTVGEFEQTVLGSLSEKFKHFKGQVTLTKVRTIQVYVVGEVVKPGAMTVSGLTTAFAALYQAGGPTERGSLRRLKVLSSKGESCEIDLYRYFLTGDRSQDVSLKNGDTIFVPAIENRVTVKGLVTRPAIYEIFPNTSLAQVIGMAGNALPEAYSGRVKIIRWTGNQRRRTFDVSLSDLDEMKSFILQNGDEIIVEQAIETIANTVEIEGPVKKPGSFAVTEGMRVSDLIQKAGGLIPEEASQRYGQIIRKEASGKEEIISFNLKFALLGDKRQNVELKPLDKVKIFAQSDIEADVRLVNVDGAVRRPGEYVYRDGMRLSDLMLKARGLAVDASGDAEIARAEGHESRIIRVNIHSALNNPESEDNVELKPLDRVSVLSKGDALIEPEVVLIKGQVKRPGPYALKFRGEPLSSVIKRAGGLTRTAFPEGAVFMRKIEHISNARQLETATEVQNELFRQANLDLRADLLRSGAKLESLKDVKSEVETGTRISEQVLNLQNQAQSGAAIKRSSDEEKSGFGGIEMTVRSMKNKLVRIPVPLKDVLEGKAEPFEDVSLMDGDQITIPVIPTTVMVLGAVVNPTTILFSRNRSAGYYISRAGGFSEHSNHRKTVVIKANGEVLPMRHVKRIERGDIILVPPKAKLLRPNRLKEWGNIASILGNLAVAYKVVK